MDIGSCKQSSKVVSEQRRSAVGAWYIWWQRREAVKGETIAPPNRTSFSIQALTLNYKGAAEDATPHEIPWSKPPPGTYKVNVDACFFVNGTGASGAVVRDYKGEAVAGCGEVLSNLLDAVTSEAIALKKGLELIEHLGCLPVILESDSMQLVVAFNNRIEIWSPYTAVLMECFQIASRIGQLKIQHCPREANTVAHEIARNVFDSNTNVYWDDDPPSFIVSDVMNDVSVFS